MSTPPPLPPREPLPDPDGVPEAPVETKPEPVRAEVAWEFHADERILDAAFCADRRIRAIDALGTLTVLDMDGRALQAVPRSETLRAAAIMPSGACAALAATEVVAWDETGAERFRRPCPAGRALAAGARGVVVAEDRLPVLALSPGGHERARCAVEHPVDHVTPLLAGRHVVALSAGGQFSVLDGAKVAWTLHLRANARSIAATESGVFVIAHADGAQVFDMSGACLALFDPGTRLRGAAIAGDGSALLLLDENDMLYLVEPSGYCTWREKRPRRLAFVRLSRDGRHALAVSAAGSVELLAFAREAGREQRLETSAGAKAPGGKWRHVESSVDDVEPSARLDVAPLGDLVAVSREEGARVDVLDARGRLLWRAPAPRDLVGLAFAPDGGHLVVQGHRGLVHLSRDGQARHEIRETCTHVLAGARGALAAATAAPVPRLLRYDGGVPSWETALPAPAARVLASPDLRWLVVEGEDGVLAGFDGAGARLWRRPHAARPGDIATGGPGLVVAEGQSLVGLRPDGGEAWSVAVAGRPDLVSFAGHAFVREGRNRFVWVSAEGELRGVDVKQNLGESVLVPVPARDGGGWLELNVNGRVLTAFGLDGRIAWRCEAPASVTARELVARGGLIAFRAGTQLCLLSLTPSTDLDDRASFLEV